MNIIPLSKTADWAIPDQEQLKKEFREAKKFVEVRVGKEHIFYRSFIRVRFVPLCECERIFLRVEMGEYGDFPLHEHYLIFMTKQGEELLMRFERQADAKQALAYLEANYRDIQFGKVTNH